MAKNTHKQYLTVAMEVRLYNELLTLLKQSYAVTVARLNDLKERECSETAIRILEAKEKAIRADIHCLKYRVIDYQDVPYHDN